MSPVIVEYGEKARGEFQITNDTDFPLAVTLEPESFDLTGTSQVKYRPLDKDIALRLSEMSFRVPPQSTHHVFYQATVSRPPAWFVIFSQLGGLPAQSGVSVRVLLPHTVYLVQKGKLTTADVVIRAAHFLAQAQQEEIELANLSPKFERVETIEVRSGRKRQKGPSSFPFFPNAVRTIQVPWQGPEAPDSVVIHFKNYVVKKNLEPSARPDF